MPVVSLGDLGFNFCVARTSVGRHFPSRCGLLYSTTFAERLGRYCSRGYEMNCAEPWEYCDYDSTKNLHELHQW